MAEMTGAILLASVVVCLLLALGLIACCAIVIAAYVPKSWR